VSEDKLVAPQCSADGTPKDSCPNMAGIDPKNNIMSYISDFCSNELTPGQMTRMIALVKANKQYIIVVLQMFWILPRVLIFIAHPLPQAQIGVM
jgi:hypothetical protein